MKILITSHFLKYFILALVEPFIGEEFVISSFLLRKGILLSSKLRQQGTKQFKMSREWMNSLTKKTMLKRKRSVRREPRRASV